MSNVVQQIRQIPRCSAVEGSVDHDRHTVDFLALFHTQQTACCFCIQFGSNFIGSICCKFSFLPDFILNSAAIVPAARKAKKNEKKL